MRKILLWLLLALPAPALAQITPGGGGITIGTTTITGGTTGRPLYDNAGVAGEYSTLPVAFGGTNCTSATITCFNNITGFTAAGTTGTTSTNLVFSTSPTLVTPVLGVATATSLAINGATIGSYNFALTGTASFSSTADFPQAASNTTNGTNAILSFGGTRGTNNLYISAFNNKIYFGGQGQNIAGVSSAGLQLPSGAQINWQNSSTSVDATADLILTRAAAATLQHGAADAAAPVAQTISFQSVVAGTSNTAGVNATFKASAGTGTGAGGSFIFQVAAAGSSGTAQNAFATALTIDSTKLATFAAGLTMNGVLTNGSGAGSWTASGDGNGLFFTANNSTAAALVGGNSGGVKGTSGTFFGWTASSSAVYATAIDTGVFRDAAAIVSVRGVSTTTPGAISLYTYGASPPAAGAASTARLYVDTSGGKDRLVVVFSSGAAQVIATQP